MDNTKKIKIAIEDFREASAKVAANAKRDFYDPAPTERIDEDRWYVVRAWLMKRLNSDYTDAADKRLIEDALGTAIDLQP